VASAAATVATQASPGSAGEDLLEVVGINPWMAAVRCRLRQGRADRRSHSPKRRGPPAARTPRGASPAATMGSVGVGGDVWPTTSDRTLGDPAAGAATDGA
jgi:hypothetical protein